MKKVIIILTLITAILIYTQIKEDEVVIPDSAIRLRVIPNSNSSQDQNMKNKVKNYLEKNTYVLLENTNNIDDARNRINDNLENINSSIDHIFKENNYAMSYDVNFGYNYFPQKKYRKVKYEEGYYESLVVTLGNGEGKNWWCVLFPPLCLLEAEETSQKEEVEYKFFIKEIIDKYL